MKHHHRISDNGSAKRRSIAVLLLAMVMFPGGSLLAQTPSYLSALRVGGSRAEGGQTLPKRSIQASAGSAIRIAPNPFTGAFTFRCDGVSGRSRILIADMMGRIVETREIADGGQEVVLGAQIPPGLYMVQIIQGEERRTTMIHKVK